MGVRIVIVRSVGIVCLVVGFGCGTYCIYRLFVHFFRSPPQIKRQPVLPRASKGGVVKRKDRSARKCLANLQEFGLHNAKNWKSASHFHTENSKSRDSSCESRNHAFHNQPQTTKSAFQVEPSSTTPDDFLSSMSMSRDSLEVRRDGQVSGSFGAWISRRLGLSVYDVDTTGSNPCAWRLRNNSTTNPIFMDDFRANMHASSTSGFRTQTPEWDDIVQSAVPNPTEFCDDNELSLDELLCDRRCTPADCKLPYYAVDKLHHSTPDYYHENIGRSRSSASPRNIDDELAESSLGDDVLQIDSCMDSSCSFVATDYDTQMPDCSLPSALGRSTVENMDHMQHELRRLNADIGELVSDFGAVGARENQLKVVANRYSLGTTEAVRQNAETLECESAVQRQSTVQLGSSDNNNTENADGCLATASSDEASSSAAVSSAKTRTCMDIYIDDEYSNNVIDGLSSALPRWYDSVQVRRLSEWSFDVDPSILQTHDSLNFRTNAACDERTSCQLGSFGQITSECNWRGDSAKSLEVPDAGKGTDERRSVTPDLLHLQSTTNNRSVSNSGRKSTADCCQTTTNFPSVKPSIVGVGIGNEIAFESEQSSNGFRTATNWEVKNIGDRLGIFEYVRAELDRCDSTQKSDVLRQGYYQISRLFSVTNVRRIRADNYCVLRAVLYEVLVNDLIRSNSMTVGFDLKNFFVKLNQIWKAISADLPLQYVVQWNFANRIPYVRGQESQLLAECLHTLNRIVDAVRSKGDRGSREAFLVSLLNRRPDVDLRLLEATKLLMMSKALQLFRDLENGGAGSGSSVPLFAWLLFASVSPGDLFHLHINPLGDSANAQKLELQLLGYALGVRIQMIRPARFSSEDFVLYFPDEAAEFPAVVSVINEEMKRYSVSST